MNDYLKHLLIRTPLERPAMMLVRRLRLRAMRKHPELYEIHVEPMRIEQALAHLIKPDFNCVDVGAHVGSTLSQIVRLAPCGSHHAFEPVPEKARLLRRKFPEVRIHDVALGEAGGAVEFFINRTASGFSGLRRRTSGDGNRLTAITVRRERLDDVLPQSYRVDFLKVDVEGGELSVLRGAERILTTWRPIILFESTKDGHRAFDSSADALYKLLCEEFGYGIHTLKGFLEGGMPLRVREFSRAHDYPFQAFNFLATTSLARLARPAVVEQEQSVDQRLPISCRS